MPGNDRKNDLIYTLSTGIAQTATKTGKAMGLAPVDVIQAMITSLAAMAMALTNSPDKTTARDAVLTDMRACMNMLIEGDDDAAPETTKH